MKFKKKSKGVIAITAILSVFVCACFFVTGVYTASFSADLLNALDFHIIIIIKN